MVLEPLKTAPFYGCVSRTVAEHLKHAAPLAAPIPSSVATVVIIPVRRDRRDSLFVWRKSFRVA